MGNIFSVILRMSLTASIVIAAVIVMRMLLLRAPRKYSYLLWLVVLVRLVCPFAIQTDYGFIPNLPELFGTQERAGEMQNMMSDSFSGAAGGVWNTGAVLVPYEDERVIDKEDWADGHRPADSGPEQSIQKTNWLSTWGISGTTANVLGWCWLAGAIGAALYGSAGYVVLVRRLKGYETQTLREIGIGHGKRADKTKGMRICVRERIRMIEADEIASPFTIGLLHPTICLPSGLLPAQREMVIAHECTHIRRKDNVIKTVAYLARCMHWFNPLAWLAFRMFENDMEISCDETALRKLGYECRKDYAKTLLALSSRRGLSFGMYPVAFGEKNTEARIRNVLSLKKAKGWVIAVSTTAVLAAAVLLLVNQRPSQAAGTTDPPAQADHDVDPGSQTDHEENPPAQADHEGDPPAQTDHEGDLPAQTDHDVDQNDAGAQAEADRFAREQEELSKLTDAFRSARELEREGQRVLTDVSQMISDGTLTEGDTYLERSEHYSFYEMIELGEQEAAEAAGSEGQRTELTPTNVETGLLCNPRIGADNLSQSGETLRILYAYPLGAEEGKGLIVSGSYGSRANPISGQVTFHSGYDFAAETGMPVYAAANGVVYRTGFDSESGNYVILLHENGEVTYYTHCSEILDFVKPGQIVSCGEQIAVVGGTGKSTGPHLHFSVSRNGAYVEPRFASDETFGELGFQAEVGEPEYGN